MNIAPDNMEKQHKKYMRMAISLSEKNVNNALGGPFGAVIVMDGKLISRGANQVSSHNDPTAHAEVTAIRKACRKLKTFDLSGAVIYTSCEPCPMCLSAIYWAKISKIFYANTKQDAGNIGFNDHFIYTELALPYQDRKLPISQLLREEALPVFHLWEKSEFKTPY